MIVSHLHRFIFIAVPRTATHAIRAALRDSLAPGDWEQQDLFRSSRLPIAELAAVGHGHLGVAQAQSHLPAETWGTYFKFAFVRNPFDRFVSACFFLNRKTPDFERRATSFMSNALRVPRFRQRVLIQPQHRLLCGADRSIGVDFVGRYEALQDSFAQACERIGLPAPALQTHNASRHGDYRHYLDEPLREALAAFYAEDFRLFSYPTGRSDR